MGRNRDGIAVPTLYECQHCEAIVEEGNIIITKTEISIIKQCPVCGYGAFKLIEGI